MTPEKTLSKVLDNIKVHEKQLNDVKHLKN